MKYSSFDKEAVNIGYRFSDLENLVHSIQLANYNSTCFAPSTHENDTEPVVDESFGDLSEIENVGGQQKSNNGNTNSETCTNKSQFISSGNHSIAQNNNFA